VFLATTLFQEEDFLSSTGADAGFFSLTTAKDTEGGGDSQTRSKEGHSSSLAMPEEVNCGGKTAVSMAWLEGSTG